MAISKNGEADTCTASSTRAQRMRPPFWQHDAYTLTQLANAVAAAATSIAPPIGSDRLVLDFGAGDAPYRPLFDTPGTTYIESDIDAQSALRIVPGTPLALADASVQTVLSFQVLEHVWDLDWYLGEAHRVLAADGALVLSTHGTWLYHPHPTDFRRWTRDGLLEELRTRGFTALQVVALIGPLAWTTQFRAIGYSHLLNRLPLIGRGLAVLSNIIMHLRMKVEDAITPQNWIDTNASVYLVIARKS